VLRPFRNTIAANIGTSDLPFYLLIIVIVMLLVNPIYSLIVSKVRLSKLVPSIYGFFIFCLSGFYLIYNYFPEILAVKTFFYVWYNIFNFFVVAIFWAMTVNSFDIEDGKKFFGIISGFGSLGASCGGALVDGFLYDKENLSLLIAILSLLLAILFSSRVQRKEIVLNTSAVSTLSSTFEQFSQIRTNSLIRQFVLYAFVWTCLSTALWFFQLEIINNYTNDSAEKTRIFGRADSIVPLITLFVQIFLTASILRSKMLGIKFVLTVYGLIFSLAFLAVSGYFSDYLLASSAVLIFLILQGVMRPFEYGLNKPAREAVYTTLNSKEKYKSTVFIDTFTNRFGDASGGLLFNVLFSFGLVTYVAPLAIIPLAIYLMYLGFGISKSVSVVKSK
jgi:AAA family ATP:ADP antiporter